MPRRKKRHGKPDPLLVQTHIKIKAPEGKTFSKKVLQDIVERGISGGKIPKNVEITIFWRNPARRGEAGYWRYHRGADLSNAPHPLQSYPRGNLQDAFDSLGNAIFTGIIIF